MSNFMRANLLSVLFWCILGLVVTSLVGCATPYQSRQDMFGFDRGQGYEDLDLGDNTYVIAFYGNAHTTLTSVKMMLLRRSKELCAEKGFQRFDIVESDGHVSENVVVNQYFAGTVSKPEAHITIRCK